MSKKNIIYVVDEDSSARNGLVRLFRKSGHDVRDFASLSSFIKTLEHNVSGCLVLDSQFLGRPYNILRKELVLRGVSLSLIIISASNHEASKRISLELKAAGFFRKPVDGIALLDSIDWELSSKVNNDEKNVNSK